MLTSCRGGVCLPNLDADKVLAVVVDRVDPDGAGGVARGQVSGLEDGHTSDVTGVIDHVRPLEVAVLPPVPEGQVVTTEAHQQVAVQRVKHHPQDQVLVGRHTPQQLACKK